MQYTKGLINKNLKTISNKQWYHQRFDACPNFIYLVGEMEDKPEPRKMKGGEFINHLVIFENDRCDWYMDKADLKRISSLLIQRSYKEKGIGQKMMKQWDKDKVKFYNQCKKFDKLNLTSLTNSQLNQQYQSFLKAYFDWVSMSSVIDGFSLGSDNFIYQEIKNFLDKRGIKKNQGKIFTDLTAPVIQSFINDSEVSLFKIALAVSKNKKLKNIFLNNFSSVITKKIKNFPQAAKLLSQHQQNYFWVKNNYIDHYILDETYFIKEIKGILKSNINIALQIKKIEGRPSANKSRKQKLIKKLALPQHLESLLEILEVFSYWQDERKKSTFLTTHYCALLIEEIGKRFGYTLAEMKYLMSDEVISLFFKKSKIINKREIHSRKAFSLFYDKKGAYDVVTGSLGRRLQKTDF